MSDPTFTQRVAPLLEKFEIREWEGERVAMALRTNRLVRACISPQSCPGPGGTHRYLQVELSFESSNNRGKSLNEGMKKLAHDLEQAVKDIHEYLEWVAQDPDAENPAEDPEGGSDG